MNLKITKSIPSTVPKNFQDSEIVLLPTKFQPDTDLFPTAQLQALDCNFITIDWSECANNCCYFGARDCAILVGSYLEQLLQALVAGGADPASFHLMGHSLGAHLVSQVSNNGLRVGRITGTYDTSTVPTFLVPSYRNLKFQKLRVPRGKFYFVAAFDPPQWGFHLEDSKHRIDPDDAALVDVIHTSSTLGWSQVLGQMDFFPNSAGRQPGCSFFNSTYRETPNLAATHEENKGKERKWKPLFCCFSHYRKRKNLHRGISRNILCGWKFYRIFIVFFMIPQKLMK